MTKTGTAWGDYVVGGMQGIRDTTTEMQRIELNSTNEDALIALNNFIEGFYTGNWSTPEQTPFLTGRDGDASPDVYAEDGTKNQETMRSLLDFSEEFVGNLNEEDFRW